MEMDQSEITVFNKATKDVGNWYWMRWLQLAAFIVAPVLVYYDNAIIIDGGFFWGLFTAYIFLFIELIRNWSGLKKELLLLKAIDVNNNNSSKNNT